VARFVLALEASNVAVAFRLFKTRGEGVDLCKRVSGFDAMVALDHVLSIATIGREASEADRDALAIVDVFAVVKGEVPRF